MAATLICLPVLPRRGALAADAEEDDGGGLECFFFDEVTMPPLQMEPVRLKDTSDSDSMPGGGRQPKRMERG